MAKDDTTQPVEDEANANENTGEQAPSEEVQDAINSVTEGVKGELTTNADPLEATNDGSGTETGDESDTATSETVEGEEPGDGTDSGATGEAKEAAAEPPADTQPTPELKTGKDEASVEGKKAEDPGDFVPADYSFEVTTTDGKTHTINSPQEAQALAAKLDDDPALITASQFLHLGSKTALMEQGIVSDRKVYDEQKQAHETEANKAKVQDEQLSQWQNEISYLRQKGDLPAITDALNGADWTDPKVASQPGVKETLELFKWMEGENDKRRAAGLAPDTSVVSAHTAMQLEAIKSQNQDEVSREKGSARSKGSMVGGQSPHIPSNAPKDSIIGTPGTIDDLMTELSYQ